MFGSAGRCSSVCPGLLLWSAQVKLGQAGASAILFHLHKSPSAADHQLHNTNCIFGSSLVGAIRKIKKFTPTCFSDRYRMYGDCVYRCAMWRTQARSQPRSNVPEALTAKGTWEIRGWLFLAHIPTFPTAFEPIKELRCLPRKIHRDRHCLLGLEPMSLQPCPSLSSHLQHPKGLEHELCSLYLLHAHKSIRRHAHHFRTSSTSSCRRSPLGMGFQVLLGECPCDPPPAAPGRRRVTSRRAPGPDSSDRCRFGCLDHTYFPVCNLTI